jgi:hypothetical protein
MPSASSPEGPRRRSDGRALALVAVALVAAVAAYVALQRRPAPPAPQIPSTSTPDASPPPPSDAPAPRPEPPAARLAVDSVPRSAGGDVTLRWEAVPGAETYRVRIFSTEFEEVGRYDAAEPQLTLTPRDLAHLGLPRRTFLWRVSALAGERILSTSPVTTSQLP